MMPNKNNNTKTRKSPTPTSGHTTRDRASPNIASGSGARSSATGASSASNAPPTPTHAHAQPSPRLNSMIGSSTGNSSRDVQPSPKLPANAASAAMAGAGSSGSHPSPNPKQVPAFAKTTRPIKAFDGGSFTDSDLLSQSEGYQEGHEMDTSRSVLLESPAAKSILGGEVARQKHEFYMSQSRMAAHHESGQEANDSDYEDAHDVGRSVATNAIIEKVAQDLEAASTDDLTQLLEHVQMLVEQRSHRSNNHPRPALTAKPQYGNAITAKPINSHALSHSLAAQQHHHQQQLQQQVSASSAGTPTHANVQGGRQNIPSPFKSLEMYQVGTNEHANNNNLSNSTGHSNTANTQLQQPHQQHQTSSVATPKTKPYVHTYGATTAPANAQSSPDKPDSVNTDTSASTSSQQMPQQLSGAANAISNLPNGSGPSTGSHVYTYTQPNTNAQHLLSNVDNVNRSQLRRSLSGDATHSSSHSRANTQSKMHPLATGYHTLTSGQVTAQTQGSAHSASGSGNGSTSTGAPAQQEEEEMELGFRTTPTKVASVERPGAMYPAPMEAWPPSPGTTYRPSPPILETMWKPPVHSPKVKKRHTPLHPPANQAPAPAPAAHTSINTPVHPSARPASHSQLYPTLNHADSADDNSSHTDSLTIQSFDDPVGVSVGGVTMKRSKSAGDEAYAPLGREALGLVTSPNTAFDDISVGSGNSASNYSAGGSSVKSSRSFEAQNAKSNYGGRVFSYITGNNKRM